MDQQSKIDIGVAAVLIILSVTVFILSSGYPVPKSGLPVNAFPRILASIIFLLSGALIISALRNVKKRPPCLEGFTKGPKLIVIVIGLLIGYILLLKHGGFILTSILLMVTLLLVFGERRKLILTLVPICFVITLYIIFQKFAMVPLPKGILKGIF